MIWERYKNESLLYDEGNLILAVRKAHDGMFLIQLRCIDEEYETGAKSIEEAEWRAVLRLSTRCNQIANSYHQIRDRLPSIHALAERAGMI